MSTRLVDIYAKNVNNDIRFVPSPVSKMSPVLNYEIDLDDILKLFNFSYLWIYDSQTKNLITIKNLQDYFPEYSPGGGGGGGTTNYDQLSNKPSINNVTLTGDKTTQDLGIIENVQADWDETDIASQSYIQNKPVIPTVNDAVLTVQKNGTSVGTFSSNASTGTTINITVPVDANDVGALPDTTKYGASLSLTIDNTTYVVTAFLKDQNGNALGVEQTIDLPLETVVVGGSYDDTTKKVVLTLKNGTTVEFSVADLVVGLQSEITSTNKLDADFVDDTTSAHKFVTAADKVAWNAKSDFSGSYNDLTDKPTIPNPVTVDQTYNAASTNAQSGTAVAGAISKKPGEITTGKNYTISGNTVTAGTGAEAFNNLTNNKAVGQYSHAEGYNTQAYANYSHAEGYGTKARGGSSHAEGYDTGATGPDSHAEGLSVTASGQCSHAEGNATVAYGDNSHAEGFATSASGKNSHAEGYNTAASGENSHAEGNYTQAYGANQHVQGKFNVIDRAGAYAFIIGNGTSAAESSRHNAFAIDWEGLIYVNGATTGVDVAALAATVGDINSVLEEVL